VPRIDESDAEVVEMTGIAGCEDCFAGSGDAGDLDIADLERPADLPLPGGDCSRSFRRSAIEWQHAATEDIVDGAGEGFIEAIAPAEVRDAAARVICSALARRRRVAQSAGITPDAGVGAP
jgi:hypothetical protein